MTRLQKIILIILTISLVSCKFNRDTRVEYNDYELGQRIDNNWIIMSFDEERNFKLLKNASDSNQICKTIGDTIWYLLVENISENKAFILKENYDRVFKTIAEEKYIENVAGIWNCYQYQWINTKDSLEIRLSKCGFGKNEIFEKWTLEIQNLKLADDLNRYNDPYYNLKHPRMNELF
jgi:hypothetical protein